MNTPNETMGVASASTAHIGQMGVVSIGPAHTDQWVGFHRPFLLV